MRVEVRGGPADGARSRARKLWQWIDVLGRCQQTPGVGRGLYHLEDDVYVFAGGRAGHCVGCGAVVDGGPDGKHPSRCPLCGCATKGSS